MLSDLDDELLSEEKENDVRDESLNTLIFPIYCEPYRAPYWISIYFGPYILYQ